MLASLLQFGQKKSFTFCDTALLQLKNFRQPEIVLTVLLLAPYPRSGLHQWLIDGLCL